MGSDELIKCFKKKNAYGYMATWFNKEFKVYTDIDIYSLPFDKEKGYSIYSFSSFDLLVLKLEALEQCFQSALRDFLGINIKNLSVPIAFWIKISADISQVVRANISFSSQELERLYANKYVRHFYTNKEIQKFISRWCFQKIRG